MNDNTDPQYQGDPFTG